MIHTTVGQLGHLFIILSFVTALVATVAYFISALGKRVDKVEPVEEPELAYAGEMTSFNGKTAKRKPPKSAQLPEKPEKDDWLTLARVASSPSVHP